MLERCMFMQTEDNEDSRLLYVDNFTQKRITQNTCPVLFLRTAEESKMIAFGVVLHVIWSYLHAPCVTCEVYH